MAAERGDSRIGTMFGPYEIRSKIGAGGMGEVYQAYDTTKDRVVALKLLKSELASQSGYQERFRRESRLAARLQEPHVIPVHDWGEIDGVLYIDMRFVEGDDLHAALKKDGPFDPLRATSVVRQIAGALDAAHAAGLIHRDVKPENILLTPSDFAYLVDFGIAHIGGETGLTTAGSAIGSLAYMAPERFTGGQAGPEADVYALACVLYEMLTGQPPYPHGDITQMMGAHLMQPAPRPSTTRQGLDPAFDSVIARGMEKRPELRYSSAGELAQAARAAASGEGVTDNYPPFNGAQRTVKVDHAKAGRRLQIILAVAAAALLAIGLVVGIWLFAGEKPKSNTAQAPVTTTKTAPSTSPTTTTTQATPDQSSPTVGGTDDYGFVDYPGARCYSDTYAAAVGRTAQTVFTICTSGPGNYYYVGVRLSDNDDIELPNAIRTSGGYDVNNPADNTKYQIRPDGLTITQANGQVSTEPMVEWWAE
jgi:serine/threonine protein kinase